ncbi:MAG TPA: PQQ-dependent sugar dehydrogenase [Actinomycetota bacterium]|nr:PQQ-dependent sugar dehydrogenase [Actinomycetota bacterium]
MNTTARRRRDNGSNSGGPLLRAQPLPGAGGGQDGRRRGHRRLASTLGIAVLLALVGGGLLQPVLAPVPARAAPLPDGFSEEFVATGFSLPVSVQFSPDGRIFVAERSGLIKVLDGVGDPTPAVVADLRPQVYEYYDRGLLGFALDPGFPSNPYAHVLYTYDAAIGGTAPRWRDECPNPPGENEDGCVASGRLSRLRIEGNSVVSEQVLINDWCTQYPSHSTGDLRFGSDGSLYVSGGDGASFTFVDYGQRGSPRNPCGDPPGGSGASLSPPASEGGAMRSQDLRTTGDPVGLDGTVLRVDPDTGAGLPDNPMASSSDPNARRIIAHGLRNPFRMTFRPGTDELWLGDVGWVGWEEINRIADPTGSVKNFGWPCYEGNGRQPGYDGPDFTICENLYAQPSAVTPPWFVYSRDGTGIPGEAERCLSNGLASTSGVSFYTGSSYPARYRNALFFADYSRSCIYAMPAGAGGLPDPAQAEAFAAAAQPVYLTMGPDGNLWYVNLGGTLRRILYAGGGGEVNRVPTAAVTATPTQGAAPLAVQFDGSGSRDPDSGDSVTAYDWDLDGNGTYGDAAGPRPAFTYQQPGTYNAALRVTDSHGARSGAVTVRISVGNTGPTARITAPATGTTWQPGDPIAFAGTATDPQDGTLPAARLSWAITLQHCADGGGCHAHPLQNLTGVAGGSLPAPDHEYPSHIDLQLTATDSGGLTDTATLRLDPRTVDLTFASEPSGMRLTVGPTSQVTPFTRRVIAGSRNSVSAPTPQDFGGAGQLFTSWSDGGAASHDLVAPGTATTYTARYRAPEAPAPAATALALQPSRTQVGSGEEVVLDGRLTAVQGGAGIAGEQVQLDARAAGATAWSRLDTAATDTDGTVRFSHRPAGTTEYQLRFAGSDGKLPSASELARVAIGSSVTARVSPPSIPLGIGARVSGTVTPASPGELVVVETSSGGGWRQLATGPLDQAGRFDLYAIPTATGATGLRVRKLAGDASGESVSATLGLKVYRTVIAGIRIVGPGLNGEYLELRNTGTTDVNLGTWTVTHQRLGWTVPLRPYTLRAGQSVRVYSGLGATRSGRLFLNRRMSVWRSSRTGDLIQVRDGSGLVAAAIRYQKS